MKQISSVAIALIGVLLLLLSIKVLDTTKNTYENSQQEFNEFQKLAEEFTTKKDFWYTKDEVKEQLNKHLQSLSIKSRIFLKKDKILRVDITEEDLKKLDKLVNKIMNDRFIINKIELDSKNLVIEFGI